MYWPLIPETFIVKLPETVGYAEMLFPVKLVLEKLEPETIAELQLLAVQFTTTGCPEVTEVGVTLKFEIEQLFVGA